MKSVDSIDQLKPEEPRETFFFPQNSLVSTLPIRKKYFVPKRSEEKEK